MDGNGPTPTDATGGHGGRAELRDLVTIFAVSAAIMLYQLTLTRVLSVVVWYHFAFLTISLVMLGLGAPGVWFALSNKPLRYLPGLLLTSGVAVPLSVALLVQFGPQLIEASAFLLVVCVLPATLSLGAVVCLILIKAQGPQLARAYGIDLFGSALAASLTIPLMDVFPTPALAAAVGALPLGCAALHGGRARRLAFAALVVVLGISVSGVGLQVTRSKTYDEAGLRPLYERWSPTARITVFDERFFMLPSNGEAFTWGRGSRFPQDSKLPQYWLEQDGNAGSPILAFDGDLSKLEPLLYDVTTVGYQVGKPQRVAIIGAGGGRDILSALVSGAQRIDAVEINRRTVEAVSDRLAEFSGDPYNAAGVRPYVREGRSHLTHSPDRFDLIQISLIDSWAASAAGAFALAENNLYTLEAFQLYAGRLTNDGMISTTRWLSETPRLIALARAALRSLGVADPDDHLVLVGASRAATLLTSLQPFSAEALAQLDAICEQRGFDRIYPPRPGERIEGKFIARAFEDDLERARENGFNATAPTDDSPYFFQVVSPFTPRGRAVAVEGLTGLAPNVVAVRVLRETMLAVSALGLVLFLAPLLARRMALGVAGGETSTGTLLRGSLYFAAIGAGFMLLENLLVQRFVLYLGHPSYATTVIIAALLVGMGVGSTQAPRVGLVRLQEISALTPAVLLAAVLALPPLFEWTLGLPLAARVAITAGGVLPLGVLLGLFFPLGMERFGDGGKPWFWAINGVFGVVASVLSLALSMEYGYTVVGIASSILYAVAAFCLSGRPGPRSARADADAGGDAVPRHGLG